MYGRDKRQNKIIHERRGSLGSEDNMKINGTDGMNISAGAIGMDAGIGGQSDPMVRDLQRQIEGLQNRMKELSSNPELTPEMKAKKRQEIQKQISDLEMQLRQRQIEVRREEVMKKRQENYSMDEMLGTNKQDEKSGKQSTGLSAGSMEALISADASMKQADVHGNIATKMEGKAGVLEAEIKQDEALGASVPGGKREALAEVQAKADEATSAQMGALAQANEAAKKAAEADKEQSAEKTDDKSEDKASDGTRQAGKSGTEAKQTGESATEVSGSKAEGADEMQKATEDGNTFDTVQMGVPFSRGYQPVDIKL